MAKQPSPLQITKKKLLVVEGNDEKNFFEELFRHMAKENITDILDVGGKDNFKNSMPALTKISTFNDVEAIAVIRDANGSCQSAFDSVKRILKENELLPPKKPGEFSRGNPKVGIFIMPDNKNCGMLENLCLETVADEAGMECVNRFIDCANQLENPPKNKDIPKAKIQAFLAIMPEVPHRLGIGAKKGYWDFDSAPLEPLKKFLWELVT